MPAMTTALTRRTLLRLGGATALALLGLDSRYAAEAPGAGRVPAGFGPLVRDPAGILDLPAGFRYVVVSRSGETMADGLLVPGAPDGMACFASDAGTLRLVRNHELRSDLATGAFGRDGARFTVVDRSRVYDSGDGKLPALGGTTTLVIDAATGACRRQWLSLAGTRNNCAGGPTPWGSWISCEEDTQRMGVTDQGVVIARDHGYAFEVPAAADSLVVPTPLPAMGRFRREAVAVDPASGAIYQTEDTKDGVFYRFLPAQPGRLSAGGRLQALRIRDYAKPDARNWYGNDIAVGHERAVDWVDVADPSDRTADQAAGLGAQSFSRGEGCWYGHGAVWFASTDGGRTRKGQIWRYQPSPVEGTPAEREQPGRLTLFVQPDDGGQLENVDNVTVAPWGDVLGAEDNSSPDCTDENRLLGITPAGAIYPLASTMLSEIAGPCFSPDGRWLFLNIQAGITCAVTGPWPNA